MWADACIRLKREESADSPGGKYIEIISRISLPAMPGRREAAATAAATAEDVGLDPDWPEDSDFIDEAVPPDMGEAAEDPMDA